MGPILFDFVIVILVGLIALGGLGVGGGGSFDGFDPAPHFFLS